MTFKSPLKLSQIAVQVAVCYATLHNVFMISGDIAQSEEVDDTCHYGHQKIQSLFFSLLMIQSSWVSSQMVYMMWWLIERRSEHCAIITISLRWRRWLWTLPQHGMPAREFGLASNIFINFFHSNIESILTCCFSIWYCCCSTHKYKLHQSTSVKNSWKVTNFQVYMMVTSHSAWGMFTRSKWTSVS